jgi:hypothetical protein
MRYIMVTSWEGHWNNLSGNRTYYTERMLRNGMDISKLKENTETIFIKKHKIEKTVECCWEGKVFGLRRMEYKNKPACNYPEIIDTCGTVKLIRLCRDSNSSGERYPSLLCNRFLL